MHFFQHQLAAWCLSTESVLKKQTPTTDSQLTFPWQIQYSSHPHVLMAETVIQTENGHGVHQYFTIPHWLYVAKHMYACCTHHRCVIELFHLPVLCQDCGDIVPLEVERSIDYTIHKKSAVCSTE